MQCMWMIVTVHACTKFFCFEPSDFCIVNGCWDMTIFNSCNTGTSGLPDMYTRSPRGPQARGLRVYISGRSRRVPVLQLLCTTSLAS